MDWLDIACTRAMHELHLTHVGPRSRFLEFAAEPGSPSDVDRPEAEKAYDSAIPVV
ncbi:hypothetical protein [Streptomyces sp. E2N166]|uniref:hypothetical protein n=1 Tax=Streptomyces sp. E2N166 TaxID=1851909 RepID=UPI00187D5177|nr:hypothetical protein [Streptomyces sp. E2N166]